MMLCSRLDDDGGSAAPRASSFSRASAATASGSTRFAIKKPLPWSSSSSSRSCSAPSIGPSEVRTVTPSMTVELPGLSRGGIGSASSSGCSCGSAGATFAISDAR